MSTRYIWYKYPASYAWGDSQTVKSYPWSSLSTGTGLVNAGNSATVVVANGTASYRVPGDGYAPDKVPGKFEGAQITGDAWSASYLAGGYGNSILVQRLHPDFVWGLAGYPYTVLGASSGDLICLNLSQSDNYGPTAYYVMQDFKVYGAPKGSDTPSGSKTGEVSSNNSNAYPNKDNASDGYWYLYWASDEPDPTQFTVAGSVGISKTLTLNATVNPYMMNTMDSKLTVKFVFQVSLNGGSYTDIASVDAPYSKGGENVSTSYTIPTGTETVQFRVYAKDSSGFTSSNYLYSDLFNLSSALYTISVNASPTKGGTVTGGGSFAQGTSVTVRATASSNYTFTGWRESGVIVSTLTDYTFTVSVDRNLTAVFQATTGETTYTVTVEISPPGSGTVTGTGEFPSGTSVTLNAIPAEGYEFVRWTVEDGSYINLRPTLTITVDMDYHLIAVFRQKSTQQEPSLWVGIGDKARKGVELYIGVDGKARRVVEGYIGVNGKARKFL